MSSSEVRGKFEFRDLFYLPKKKIGGGVSDGTCVGDVVGGVVGRCEGTSVGITLGTIDGQIDGIDVGREDGVAEGIASISSLQDSGTSKLSSIAIAASISS